MTITTKAARRVAAIAAIATATAVAGCGGTDTTTAAVSAQPGTAPGAASSQAPQGTTPGGTSTPGTASGQAPQGMPFDTAAIAKELGVSESKLTAALEASRPAQPQAGEQPSQSGGPDAMFTKLAKALGISESKVRAAFQSAMPQGGPLGAQGQGAQAAPNGTAPSAQSSGSTTAS